MDDELKQLLRDIKVRLGELIAVLRAPEERARAEARAEARRAAEEHAVAEAMRPFHTTDGIPHYGPETMADMETRARRAWCETNP